MKAFLHAFIYIPIKLLCLTYTFIHDQKTDLGQTEFPGGYEVVQSARSSHHNVHLMNHSATSEEG